MYLIVLSHWKNVLSRKIRIAYKTKKTNILVSLSDRDIRLITDSVIKRHKKVIDVASRYEISPSLFAVHMDWSVRKDGVTHVCVVLDDAVG